VNACTQLSCAGCAATHADSCALACLATCSLPYSKPGQGKGAGAAGLRRHQCMCTACFSIELQDAGRVSSSLLMGWASILCHANVSAA
jgi:hypothetical protein